MMQNAYFLAKIGADTAKNEQHFAEILPIGRRVTGRACYVEGQPPPLRRDGLRRGRLLGADDHGLPLSLV